MEAEVSATLEACTCVFFTTFCTLMLISCMVLVTSSIAEDACTLTFADSSAAPATWLEPAETCEAPSRVVRTISCRPWDMRRNALPSVSRFERGVTSTVRSPSATAMETAGHFLQVRHHIVEGGGQRADFVVAVDVDVLIEVAGIANFARHGNQVLQRFGDGLAMCGKRQTLPSRLRIAFPVR